MTRVGTLSRRTGWLRSLAHGLLEGRLTRMNSRKRDRTSRRTPPPLPTELPPGGITQDARAPGLNDRTAAPAADALESRAGGPRQAEQFSHQCQRAAISPSDLWRARCEGLASTRTCLSPPIRISAGGRAAGGSPQQWPVSEIRRYRALHQRTRRVRSGRDLTARWHGRNH